MASGPPPAPRGGLSLYANLLDPTASTPGTISSAPVTYSRPSEDSAEQDEAAKKQQALAASLRFQPTKRPQIAAQKARAKAIASKISAPPTGLTSVPGGGAPSVEPAQNASIERASPQPPAPKTSLADWATTASDDDVNNFYADKPQRGGRKKRKKNKETVEIVQNWDDIYDPSRPNNYEEYKHSEEKIREVREWKDLLYRHRTRRRGSSGSESDRPMNRRFAPPPMSFAPPPNINDEIPPPPSPPAAEISDDATGEDAYARRMKISQALPSVMDAPSPSLPPPPPSLPPPPALSGPSPPPPPGQITRAPVRYDRPAPLTEIPLSEEELAEARAVNASPVDDQPDQPRSIRPGQAGFAERLLAKYGWTKGQGLGAQGTGIINPLYAKIDKRKKKSDAEGGGYATPAGTGKILGGNKSKGAQAAEEEGKFGAMSEVVRLEGMLTGLNLDEELEREEGGIMQEIGEECEDKYGSVQRVFIRRPEEDDDDAVVFVQFVSQLSALRAVNALEGRIFNGNPIKARFWPKEKFDSGVYS